LNNPILDINYYQTITIIGKARKLWPQFIPFLHDRPIDTFSAEMLAYEGLALIIQISFNVSAIDA